MTLPYGVISDCHYHKWDAFSTTNAEGLNSRLEIQLEATKEAAIAMKKAGCKYMLVAGDTFHVRGTVSPSVLHYVTETYKWIINELESNQSEPQYRQCTRPAGAFALSCKSPLCSAC